MNRESLLDALTVLYTECEKESHKNNDKQVVEFVNKCKFGHQMHFPEKR